MRCISTRRVNIAVKRSPSRLRNWRSRLNSVTFRDERPGDEAAIRALVDEAFAGAPHSSGTEAAIVDALRRADALTVSIVATLNAQIIGHVAISPVKIDGAAGQWFGLGPVAVSPYRQGQGVGAALINRALERLRKVRAAGCVLLGDPNYYARFGFAADPALIYPGPPPENFQRLILNGPPASGEVRYHSAFDAH